MSSIYQACHCLDSQTIRRTIISGLNLFSILSCDGFAIIKTQTLRRERLACKVRSAYDKIASASPIQSETASAIVISASSSTTASPSNTDISSGVLRDALEKLGQEEQKTIRFHLSDLSNAPLALEEVCGAVERLQHESEEKRWHWTYRGREIYLQSHVDKVVKLLDKFKSTGDVVANVDPIHIGLPLAGNRTLLEVAISDINLRSALITGVELSLHIGNRLKVYQDYLVRLTISLATDNFRKALVELYSHTLGFLARAIHVLQLNSAKRKLYAVWSLDDIANFEDKCNSLCREIEIDARNSDRQVLYQWKKEMDAELQALREIHNVNETLNKIDQRTGWMKLETARDATYDSYKEGGLARCLPGTRTEILERITHWSFEETSEKIFLAMCFFFKRGHETRSHAGLLFPTIAKQLAAKFPDIGNAITAALDEDPLICEKHPSVQFKQLLLHPLRGNSQIGISPRNVNVVIDALDECEGSENIEVVLRLLSQIESIPSMRLRIFVTSRPELPVELGFRDMSGNLHHDIQLEEAQVLSIARDIRIFYKWEFDGIRKKSSLYLKRLPIEWPGEDRIQELVELAGQLFIFAFTITRYISEGDAQERLNLILAQGNEQQTQSRVADFKTVVGSIVLLSDPLSASSLSNLLAVPVEKVDRILRPLHSVLNIPKVDDGIIDPGTAITLFHLSFRDFLVDQELKSSNRFWIDKEQTHRELGRQCIRLLGSDVLKEDICGVKKPGVRRANVTKNYIDGRLPDAVVYACCFWIDHVVSSGGQGTDDNGHVFEFLKKHFLHWMEAMSWLGKAAEVILKLEELQSVVDVDRGIQHIRFLNDASRFALRNRAVIDEAPLQAHLSALLFAPSKSIMRRTFGGSLGEYLNMLPKVPEQWNAERLKLEGHESWVNAVAISADGKTVASGSEDGTVRLWSTATGEQIKCFRIRGIPRQMRYTDGDKALETDVGVFNLNSLSDFDGDLSISPTASLVLNPPWVQYNGYDIIRLPHEYRGVCSATHDTFLAIGQASGVISFFSFNP